MLNIFPAGMLSASWLDQFTSVLLLYGLIAGLGAGIVYSPAVIIVGYYFERYRAIATGIAMCGSSAGIVCLSPAFAACIERYGWQRTVQIQAGLMASCILLCLFFRQIPPTQIVVGNEEEDEDDATIGGNTSVQLPLDECADAISETSSQIEFSYIFSMVPHSRMQQVATAGADMKATASGQMMMVGTTPTTEQFSIVSRRTGAVSMKTFRSRYVALYQEEPLTTLVRQPCCCSCKSSHHCWQQLTAGAPYLTKVCPCCRLMPAEITDIAENRRTGDASVQGTTTISNCWHTGPMNRQDIFYSGSLIRIPEYRNDYRSVANVSALTMPTENAILGGIDGRQKCFFLPKALTNVMHMLVDVSLLRSATFGVILVMNFLYVLGLLTPYMFLTSE